MAYLPPHKRDSGDSSKPAPVPSSLISQFNKTLNLGGSKSRPRHQRKNRGRGEKIVYGANSISRWWSVGSEDNSIPDSIRLEPFDCKVVKRRNGAKAMVLSGGSGVEVERPWAKISERVVPNLIDSARRAMTGSESSGEEIKLSFVARIGKVLFLGNSIELENIKKTAVAEADVRGQLHKLFYTSVPSAYMNDIQHLVVPNVGFQFDSEKEHYHVKVFDKCQPDTTISCKCLPVQDNQVLQIHKVELSRIRHLVEDLSCLYKDLDLRLILCTKKILLNTDDELSDGINKLISSAVIDPEVKGGLRWPLGKESFANRFSIVGIWHTKYKAFKSATMRLKLRHADRFDPKTSVEESSCEVTIKLTGISKNLRAKELQEGPLKELVQEGVELIWNNFLTNSRPITNSVDLESIKKAAVAETDSRRQLHKTFYTSFPSAYMNNILHLVVPNVGFLFDSEKEHYHVKVFDKCQPDSIISCKCLPVQDNQKLQIHKIELKLVRHLVADMSCLYKDLDLRLILCTKNILKNMDDNLSDGIDKLISSAIIDPDVKGGLRWPLVEESVANRLSIVSVSHTKYKAFKSDTMRLKLWHADRCHYGTSVGEVISEVSIKLTEISKRLIANELDEGSLKELVQEGVELIWNNFLSNSHPVT